MRYRLGIILGIVFLFSTEVIFSQSLTLTCGGNSSEGNGSFSYSCGQVFYNVLGYNITITEGVQQPYEISEYSEDGEDGDFVTENLWEIELSAFPNPTRDYLYLTVGDNVNVEGMEMQYAMFDVEGRIIRQENIVVGDNYIDVQVLPPATYFIRVMIDGNKIKTFKVIKN